MTIAPVVHELQSPRARKRRDWARHVAAPMQEVLRRSKQALTVHAALRQLAAGKRQVQTTRKRIRDITGLHKDTVTKAIWALHDCGWIIRAYGRAGNRTWYRITFPPGDLLAWLPAAGPRVSVRSGRKRPQGTSRWDGQNRSLPLKGKGPPTAPPFSPDGAGGAASPSDSPGREPQPLVRLADLFGQSRESQH